MKDNILRAIRLTEPKTVSNFRRHVREKSACQFVTQDVEPSHDSYRRISVDLPTVTLHLRRSNGCPKGTFYVEIYIAE